MGHTDPPELLQRIDTELKKIANCGGISRAIFVALSGGKGFDQVVDQDKDTATLYQISPQETCRVLEMGVLKEVNRKCQQLDQELAAAIDEGEIQGLICISMSVDIFSRTLESASKAKIPVTGTGGTSLAVASSRFRIRLVGNSGGSVANTSFTRAVSYTYALSTYWKTTYRPWKNSNTRKQSPSARSILNACLPAFWGVCLLKSILILFGEYEIIGPLRHALEHNALPTACAVVAATSTTNSCTPTCTTIDTSSSIMASVLASLACSQSVLSGLLAGYLVQISQEKVLFGCIILNIPATMTNLVTTGGVGGAVALCGLFLAPQLKFVTSLVRYAIVLSVTAPILPPGVGAFAWGVFCCWGSKVGLYHAIFLPLILLDMEEGGPSFLGALDELTLVLVCAGVCLGSWISDRFLFPKRDLLSDSDLALCQRAVRINLCYGDFVEACYPFMEQSMFVNMSCYLASGLSSALLVGLRQDHDDIPRSLAYLPFPLALWLSGSEWYAMTVASTVAFFVPFVATMLSMRTIAHK